MLRESYHAGLLQPRTRPKSPPVHKVVRTELCANPSITVVPLKFSFPENTHSPVIYLIKKNICTWPKYFSALESELSPLQVKLLEGFPAQSIL